ncbi:hypothetical protein STHERM_c08020 [Spirochaeta thermophila DSM 6192]|uniref:Uncharacterized protein n=1 Tax=Winmispira thermophila (strain ATCC 49972 / DSM 6192 / RI 19.B1) TaxID=665571 RepID=E0RRW4_WINT6|nr:hypothetical protein STHERM_c08020 [Spirochaeta thermophila DSM 6192]
MVKSVEKDRDPRKKDDELLAHIPPGGFFRLTERPSAPSLSQSDRVQLIRKGNELLNRGEVDMARKIFLTCDYKDGLVRVGDWYMKHDKPIDAMKLYYLSGNKRKIESITQKIAGIIRHWLHEEGNVRHE